MSKFTEKAHGRVNLIGEHTDYNGGWVLPTAIKQFTQIELEIRSDELVEVMSSGGRKFSFKLGEEKKDSSWIDYLQGSTKLLSEAVKKKNQKLQGMNVHISSTIPE